jgi:hypothetical protein
LIYLVAWKALGGLFTLQDPAALERLDERATKLIETMRQKV